MFQICCSCEVLGNSELFLTCSEGEKKKSCRDILLPFTHRNRVQPAHKGEECLLCPVVFQLSSLTAAPTVLVLLYPVRAATERKGPGITALIYSPSSLFSAERPLLGVSGEFYSAL